MNQNVQAAVATGADLLMVEQLLAEMELEDKVEATVEAVEPSISEEIIEPVEPVAAEPEIDELDALLDSAQATLDTRDSYASQETEVADDQPAADKPTVEGIPVAKAKRKGRKAKVKGDDTEPVVKAHRVTFSGNRKSVVLDDRLGGKSADYLVLENADAALDAESLAAKQLAVKEALDTTVAKKVSEKCIMLFKDLAAGGRVGNAVMVSAFEVLARDGFLSSGDKGNLQGELSKRLSLGTSRSQSNQMFALFPFLKITMKDAKGHMVPNPDSTVLASVCAAHGLQITQAA